MPAAHHIVCSVSSASLSVSESEDAQRWCRRHLSQRALTLYRFLRQKFFSVPGDISAKELAKKLGYHPTTLHDCFRRLTACGFMTVEPNGFHKRWTVLSVPSDIPRTLPSFRGSNNPNADFASSEFDGGIIVLRAPSPDGELVMEGEAAPEPEAYVAFKAQLKAAEAVGDEIAETELGLAYFRNEDRSTTWFLEKTFAPLRDESEISRRIRLRCSQARVAEKYVLVYRWLLSRSREDSFSFGPVFLKDMASETGLKDGRQRQTCLEILEACQLIQRLPASRAIVVLPCPPPEGYSVESLQRWDRALAGHIRAKLSELGREDRPTRIINQFLELRKEAELEPKYPGGTWDLLKFHVSHYLPPSDEELMERMDLFFAGVVGEWPGFEGIEPTMEHFLAYYVHVEEAARRTLGYWILRFPGQHVDLPANDDEMARMGESLHFLTYRGKRLCEPACSGCYRPLPTGADRRMRFETFSRWWGKNVWCEATEEDFDTGFDPDQHRTQVALPRNREAVAYLDGAKRRVRRRSYKGSQPGD